MTTGHLMQSFGISRQQASKDINTYITEHAPKNLTYDKKIKGYVPSKKFTPLFIDDNASAYLHLLYQNNERAPHIDGLALAYAHTKVLEVPDSPIRPEVLRPLLKACRDGLRLETEYVSLNTPNGEIRLIAPTRWSTQVCAGMFGLTARRMASTATLYSAACAVSRICSTNRRTLVSWMKTGILRYPSSLQPMGD